MKPTLAHSGREIEEEAALRLREALTEIPFAQVDSVADAPRRMADEVDFLVDVSINGEPHRLICEVISRGQPRRVRDAIYKLKYFTSMLPGSVTPVVIAPFLSASSRELLKEHETAFLDFEGNMRLVLDNAYIERSVATSGPKERRELRSVFAPKSAQVLKVLLRDPRRSWKLVDLASEAQVSLGHVSNVRAALIDREWAEVSPDGMRLTRPNELIDEWRQVYQPPSGERLTYHTIMHGRDLEMATVTTVNHQTHGTAMLGGFSAARWLAGHARGAGELIYATRSSASLIARELNLRPVDKGGNITIVTPDDDGFFLDREERAPALCTSAVQTYLDLWAAGNRGEDAAEHLRKERLQWR